MTMIADVSPGVLVDDPQAASLIALDAPLVRKSTANVQLQTMFYDFAAGTFRISWAEVSDDGEVLTVDSRYLTDDEMSAFLRVPPADPKATLAESMIGAFAQVIRADFASRVKAQVQPSPVEILPSPMPVVIASP